MNIPVTGLSHPLMDEMVQSGSFMNVNCVFEQLVSSWFLSLASPDIKSVFLYTFHTYYISY